ncbi:restriction endonuclease subunit S, partial [Campylobacter jejuni]|nr:restriction endonuclease subunit S [Campylobacter jejuni]
MNLNQTLQEKYPHLEVSVLKLSEVQKDNESKRIDSEFFKKEYFDAMETMQLNQVEYLGDNMKFNSRYSQPKYDETSKIKVINSQYIRNEYIDYENAKSGYGKIVPKESVLINATGVGTLGRVFINILDFDFSIDSHINVIVVKNKTYLNPYFLAIFLQSYYGQIQIIRY